MEDEEILPVSYGLYRTAFIVVDPATNRETPLVCGYLPTDEGGHLRERSGQRGGLGGRSWRWWTASDILPNRTNLNLDRHDEVD